MPTVFVMETLHRVMHKLLENRLLYGEHWENTGFVFADKPGHYIKHRTAYNNLKATVAQINLPDMRFHDLRHSCATIALQNGVDIKAVPGMLGHFCAGFTLDTYAHVTTSAQKEAALTMGNVLGI